MIESGFCFCVYFSIVIHTWDGIEIEIETCTVFTGVIHLSQGE